MIFNSFIFLFAFLPITYLVYWGLRTANARYIWLTVTGYVFYGWWDPRFCLLMLFSTVVSYLAGLGFRKATSAGARRLLLVLPVVLDLVVLCTFKYLDFIFDNLQHLLQFLSIETTLPELHLTLPVGISFYTFHTISYIVDCYRKDVQPTRNFFEFAAYVSLFSQLVAGPIVRFRQLEEDLEGLGQASRLRYAAQGVSLFLTGLIEKCLIADSLAPFVDEAFSNPALLSTSGAWLGTFGYGMQLYFDFSGYSTMAAGLGLLFGLRIPQNFASPYQAINPSDFWRRWHISLSECMRDYIYIPLGGSRVAVSAVYRNLMLTMLIGGLWHGANWTFLFWGGWHGLWLCLYRATSTFWDKQPRMLQWIATILIVFIGWIPFRSASLRDCFTVLAHCFGTHDGDVGTWTIGAGIILLLGAIWSMNLRNPFEMHWLDSPRRWQYSFWTGSFVFGFVLALVAGWQNSPFLYFQF